MHATALVTLNMRELDRLKVVQAVVELGLKPGRAAERLGLTVRQVERLVTRYRELGAAGTCLAQTRAPRKHWRPARSTPMPSTRLLSRTMKTNERPNPTFLFGS